MKNNFKRLMSLILVFSMLIGLIPTALPSVSAQALQPSTSEGVTTFSYQGDENTGKVTLAGEMNGWDPEATPLVEGEDNLFSIEQSLIPGSYQYKFVIDGQWMDGDNLVYAVPGIKINSENDIQVGNSIELVTLNVAEDGTESPVEASYRLKEAYEGATVEGSSLVVNDTAAAGQVTVISEYNGLTAEKTINILTQMFTYTVNYKRDDNTQMNWDMWVFGDGLDGHEVDFTTENGEYAQVTFEEPISTITVITRPGDWSSQEANRIIQIPEGETSVEVWIVAPYEDVNYTEPSDDPSERPVQRQIQFNYNREDSNYDGWNLWYWSTGLTDATDGSAANPVPLEELDNFDENGQVIIPISKTATNVGYIVRYSADSENRWASQEGGDRYVETDPNALEATTKVFIEAGQSEFKQVPYLKGPERLETGVAFYYRDIELYEANSMDTIDSVNINLTKRNIETGEIEDLGSFAMTYSEENQRFEYILEEVEEGFDYLYTFDVAGESINETGLLDVSNTIDGESYYRSMDTMIDVSATTNVESIKAGEAFLVDIAIENPENYEIKEVYIEASELGQEKINVPVDLLRQNIAVPLNAAAGEKTLNVVVIDEYDSRNEAVITINTIAHDDTEETIAWDEEIIYFMLTDRFFDGDSSNNDPNGDGMFDPEQVDAFHGGDFQGIIDNVQHLVDLGITTVWVTPIVENDTRNMGQGDNKSYGYHGYWAGDFTKVEPRLGDVETLKTLIDVLHENGIKLMLDVVLNHTGYDGKTDPKFEGMLRPASGDNDLTNELSGLPDFITEDPEVSAKLVEWQSEWLNTLRTDNGNTVDYMRIDTVKHVEHDTWIEFKNAIVDIKPDFKFIGEFYGGNANNHGGYMANGMMDGILDFEFKSIAERYVKGDLAGQEARLVERNSEISFNATLGQFLSSHDEDGFMISRLNGDEGLQKVAASVQMTAKGQPVIYYGEEIGHSGYLSDHGNRQMFDWSAVENNDMLDHYQKITNIRKDNAEVFARGNRQTVYTDDSVSVFKRTDGDKTLFVALNISDEAKTVELPLTSDMGNKLVDLYQENNEFVAEGENISITIPANSNGGTAILEPVITEQTTIYVHYDNMEEDQWYLHVWTPGEAGRDIHFTSTDDFGKVAEITFPGNISEIGLIVRDENWNKEGTANDRMVEIKENPEHLYIKKGDGNVYYSENTVLSPQILAFTVDSFRHATLAMNTEVDINDILDDYDITLGGESIKDKVESIEAIEGTNNFVINFNEDLPIDENIQISFNLTNTDEDGNEIEESLSATSRLYKIFDTDEFNARYATDEELGAIYSETSTEFKVWAPTATEVNLIIYDDLYSDSFTRHPMERFENGVYALDLEGDHLGKAYHYEVHVHGEVNTVNDPYAKSVTVNGERGVVVNPEKSDVAPLSGADAENPIIYELHVRDLSIDENSGIVNKGKFLGLTETGTTSPTGQITGLDYIKSLGVTHVQLIPIYDYSKFSVDETRLDEPQYNWGYDPVNYNSPEGSYSTDPYDPFTRIEEMQTMIDTLHENGLGVIMDVVYNHVAGVDQHSFEYIVPGYYFRQDAAGNYLGGTGVGNETASERPMVRKFIVDSSSYLADTYNLDGFRFDLMGTHDIDTMNLVESEVRKINPDIFILGEGWNMDMGIAEDLRATQRNAGQISEGIAFFSDNIRDAIKGSVFNHTEKGFVSGREGQEEYILTNIMGAQGLQGYKSAHQVIQYAEAHDNHTMWDRIEISNPEDSFEDRLKMHNMGTAIVMLSQGTPFIHAGQEFARTKGGDENSYKSPDSVNLIDWARVEEFSANVDYLRELIKIRRAYSEFEIDDYETINAIYNPIVTENQLVAYSISGDSYNLYIGHNASKEAQQFEVPNAGYTVLVRDQNANVEGIEVIEVTNGLVEVPALSTLVLETKINKYEDLEISDPISDSIIPLQGWVKHADGSERFYVNDTPLKGMHTLEQTTYLFDREGNKQYGWHVIDGKAHYFDPETGGMLTGLRTIGNTTYLLSKDEGKLTGWHVIDGKAHYFDPETGGMLTGLRTIGNTTYLLSKDEGKLTGWHVIDGKEYYFSPDHGGMLTGKIKIGQTSYLLTSNGKQYGWHRLAGYDYYFSPEFGGGMITGIRKVGNTTYEFDSPNGHKLSIIR